MSLYRALMAPPLVFEELKVRLMRQAQRYSHPATPNTIVT